MSRGGEKDKSQAGTGIKQAHLQAQLCIFSQSIKTILVLIGSKKTQFNCCNSSPAEEVGKRRTSSPKAYAYRNGKKSSTKEKGF